jgi:hypothetical protein
VTGNRRLIGLVVGDEPEVWSLAGFTVDDDHVDVEGLRIRLVGRGGGAGLRGWSFEPVWPRPIDGLPTADAAPAGRRQTAAAAHPNGVTVLDHLVIGTPDVERTTSALGEAGVEPRHTIVGARGDADVLYRFFLLGTCVLELVGPAAAPAPSPADEPARFAGLAFTTESIDGLADVASEPRPAIQPGRRIAILRREIGVSVPLAFLTPRR